MVLSKVSLADLVLLEFPSGNMETAVGASPITPLVTVEGGEGSYRAQKKVRILKRLFAEVVVSAPRVGGDVMNEDGNAD